MLQHADEFWMLLKHDVNNGKESMEELKNSVKGYLKMFKFYILNEFSTILGVIIKKLKSTNEGVQNVQQCETRDNPMISCHDDKRDDDKAMEEKVNKEEEKMKKEADERRKRKEEMKKEEDERRKRKEEMKKEEEERRKRKEEMKKEEEERRKRKEEMKKEEEEMKKEEEKMKKEEEKMKKEEEKMKKEEKKMKKEEEKMKKEEEERKKREEEVKKEEEVGKKNDSMENGLSNTSIEKVNSDIEGEGSKDSLAKVGLEDTQEHKPKDSSTREGDEGVTGEKTDEKPIKNTEDANKEGTAEKDIKENKKDSNGNEEVKNHENMTIERDTKEQSKSGTGEELKREKDEPSKHATGGIAKHDKTEISEHKTSGKEKLQNSGQAKEKRNEQLMNMTQETSTGINHDKKKKTLNLKSMISKDKDNGEKGVNVDKSNKKELTEEWKVNEWNKWMRHLEEQWHLFFKAQEIKTDDWIQKKEKEFKAWITEIETKWMNYNHNLDTEYNTDLYEKYPSWSENEWKTWIRTVGKKLMGKDWIQWINGHESKLNEWVQYDWFQWKSLKFFNWEINEWKSDEYEYWAEWQNGNLGMLLNKKKKKKYLSWKNRIEREKSEWDSWTRSKELLLLKSKTSNWMKWKNEKQLSFNDWIENFIETWISKKQWNTWVIERRNALSRKKSPSY
eukprot:XP_002262598.1 tryptophan-rich antigen [Plasmodium knowlesi strain H]